jgi:SWI/SNF related-matrix-associated actin-dependent regulator of chromatin subfamily C
MGLVNLPPALTPSKEPSEATSSAAVTDTANFPIPAYSSWFRFDAVHDIDRRALAEFFINAPEEGLASTHCKYKTPTAYREYRDFMIHTFRMRPKEYLTVTTCRRHLTGDVVTIMRVHAFLEQWGLINYQVVVPSESSSGTGNLASASALLSTVAIEAQQRALPASLDAFLKAETLSLKCSACRSEIYSSAACSNASNSSLYYHHPAKRASLCASCYTNGKYPSDMASGEFVRIDPASFASSSTSNMSPSEPEWTPEETLRLMEAIEKYTDSNVNLTANNVWDAIAEQVGRPKESCLLQFLRIPTTDFLKEAASSPSSASATLKGSNFLAFPFTQSENPVLSVLAFLAGAVHPRVAAVASQAALSELSKIADDAVVSDASAMQQVAATAVACAAVNAHDLAAQEEKRIAYWRDALIEMQLKKIQLKLDSLDELEKAVETEKKEIEKQRLQIFMDRFNLKKSILQANAVSTQSSLSK